VKQSQVLAAVEAFCKNGKRVSCENPVYRLYSVLWVAVLPLRHRLIGTAKTVRGVWKKLRR
jgi:hypothetical protein